MFFKAYVRAAIAIVYAALACLAQRDLKRLIACSSVSHLGFVVLGLFALTGPALRGAVLQMVNHGLSTGLLFLLVGMVYERTHTRLIERYGGIAAVMPVFALFFVFTVLSSAGLPGLNGFVGEFLILVGAFRVDPLLAVLATTGIIFAAVYLLWMYQRVVFGEIRHEANRGLRDLSPREWAVLAPVLLFIVWIGVYPVAFTGKTEATVEALLQQVQGKAMRALAP